MVSKQAFLLIAVVIAVMFVNPAQSLEAGVRFGLAAGASFARFNVDTDSDIGIERPTRNGFTVGGILDIQINDRFSVCLEPIYAEKGSKTDFPHEWDDLDNTLEFDYILLPILFKVKFDCGKIKPYVFLGPYLGYAVKLQTVMKDSGEVIDNKDRFERSDLGMDIGMGVESHLTNRIFIFVSGSYSVGLQDISINDLSRFNNRGFCTLAGLLFEI